MKQSQITVTFDGFTAILRWDNWEKKYIGSTKLFGKGRVSILAVRGLNSLSATLDLIQGVKFYRSLHNSDCGGS